MNPGAILIATNIKEVQRNLLWVLQEKKPI